MGSGSPFEPNGDFANQMVESSGAAPAVDGYRQQASGDTRIDLAGEKADGLIG